MGKFLRGFIGAVVVLAVALPAAAATPSEFYLTMLRRGVSAYDAGRYDAAVEPLKIAAFGLLDSIEHYQIAQAHLALTHDRMGNAELSREAAHRVVVAERIQPRYASLPLSAATRGNFESLARRVITAADLGILGRSPQGVVAPPAQLNGQPQVQPPAATNTTTVPPAPVKTDPVVTKPQPAPLKTEPAPVKVDPPVVKTEPPPVKTEAPVVKTEPAPVKVEPPVVKPEPAPQKSNPPAPEPQTTPTPTRPPLNLSASFASAEQALNTARLVDARAIYRELLKSPALERSDLLRLAEGFYRARDFANALRTFEKIGPLRRGEEPFRYYIAVALYETGQYQRAKEELAAVLPFIEQTADVTRYRLKIEGAVN
jgi:hypothetical protein